MSHAHVLCWTTFDITATGIKSHYKNRTFPILDDLGNIITDVESWSRARNQQRNWETINQIISLRTLPTEISRPAKMVRDGINFWTFEFQLNNIEGLGTDSDPLGEILKDARDVPMLTGLDETPNQLDRIVPESNLGFRIAD